MNATHADYPHEPGTLYDCPACERIMIWWAQANPSLGYTITEQAIATALGTDPEADDDDPDDHEFGCTCIFCTPGA